MRLSDSAQDAENQRNSGETKGRGGAGTDNRRGGGKSRPAKAQPNKSQQPTGAMANALAAALLKK